MIYHGFRRIALAHHLLPALPAASDALLAGSPDSHMPDGERPAPTDTADTMGRSEALGAEP